MTKTERKSHIKNCNRDDYNCGGFALDTFTWFRPLPCGYPYSFVCAEENHLKIEECAEAMLRRFPDMRRIAHPSQIHDDEYAIAFRITRDWRDDDFHFLRQGKNGVWYDKRGNSEYINRFPKEKLFARAWYGKYKGEIAFFAKKIAT